MVNGKTSKCPGCGNLVELERERRLYTCGNCAAESYLNAGDAVPKLIIPPDSIIGPNGLSTLAERENELAAELRRHSARLERMRGERTRDGRKKRLTRRILTANMVIIAASALILYIDPEIDANQLAAAGVLLVLTILTLTFLFLHNSIMRSAAYRLEILEEEERKLKRDLKNWRKKIDAALQAAAAGGFDLGEKEAAEGG